MPAVMRPTNQRSLLRGFGEVKVRKRISSLEKKPARGGMPAMAITPAVMVQKVTGIRVRRPPILRMSCSPPMAWMTEPAARKSSALKKAWVIRWKMPAS